MSSDIPTADSGGHCAGEVRDFDRDRWLTALFAPEAERRWLFALYAFNVEIARTAEQVSQPMLGEIRLQWWRDALDAVFAGAGHPQPVLAELGTAVAAGRLSRAPFERLLDARAQDLYQVPPPDLAALEGYAADTAASLVELALGILAVTDSGAWEAARHVGIAHALAGLARAVPHHAAVGRVHLPADLLAAEGLDVDSLLQGEPRAAVARINRRLAEAAQGHLAAARRRRVPKQALPALLPARLADLYLADLAQAGFDPYSPRPGPSGPRKQLALLGARLRGRF